MYPGEIFHLKQVQHAKKQFESNECANLNNFATPDLTPLEQEFLGRN